MRLILASTSKYRIAQLESLGLEFKAVAPSFDEETLKNTPGPPSQLAQMLARKKAESLVERFPEALILGGDQIAALGDHIFNKPGTQEKAVQHLKDMAGRTHQLFTAIALIYKGQVWEHIDVTTLSMRSLPEKTFQDYVQFDNPVDCAGACKLESGGMALCKAIETKDPSAITGLPLIKLTDILLEVGYPLPFRRAQ